MTGADVIQAECAFCLVWLAWDGLVYTETVYLDDGYFSCLIFGLGRPGDVLRAFIGFGILPLFLSGCGFF